MALQYGCVTDKVKLDLHLLFFICCFLFYLQHRVLLLQSMVLRIVRLVIQELIQCYLLMQYDLLPLKRVVWYFEEGGMVL